MTGCYFSLTNVQFGVLGKGDAVQLHVREKKRWKKYPCCVRDTFFIQFKDPKVRKGPRCFICTNYHLLAPVLCN